jgi:isopentenyl-diphosphate delta-isomerase
VAVETERSTSRRREIGETFREWGIPTAASVGLVAPLGFSTVFATGGVQTGLDVAKAIALGATAGGIARPTLQALESGGRAGALAFLSRVEEELKVAMLLCGARDLQTLSRVPRVVQGALAQWLEQAGCLGRRSPGA